MKKITVELDDFTIEAIKLLAEKNSAGVKASSVHGFFLTPVVSDTQSAEGNNIFRFGYRIPSTKK